MKKERKAVRQRFLDDHTTIGTDVFQLVNGKVAVTPAQGEESSSSSSPASSLSPTAPTSSSPPQASVISTDADDDDSSLEDKGPLDAIREASYVSSFPVLDEPDLTSSVSSSTATKQASSPTMTSSRTSSSKGGPRVQSKV